jgi:hypothetical protein
MCIPRRLLSAALATGLLGCGSEVVLPGDDSPAALRVFSGNGQAGTVGSTLDDELVVKLTDASASPLSGFPVVFQFVNDVPGAVLTPAEATTDSMGLAAAEVRLGTSTGPLRVEARIATASALNATFLLTALEREKKRDKGDKDDDDDEDDDDEDDDDD